MSNDLSPIAATARLETATETLAEYIGYLNAQIHEEQQPIRRGVLRRLEQGQDFKLQLHDKKEHFALLGR